MATDEQIRANQENAQKSTGPVSEEGKAASSQNSLKHGLASKRHGRSFFLMRGEDPALWDEHIREMLVALDPDNVIEEMLARQAAEYSWLRQRALYLQSTCLIEGQHVLADTHFALYTRYERANTTGQMRALAELEKRQAARRKAAKEAVAEPKKEARVEAAEKRADTKLELLKARSQREEMSPQNQYAQKLIGIVKTNSYSRAG